MKLLLDEDVPEPLTPMIRHVLPEHDVQHVSDLRWKGKRDVSLYADAKRLGFDAILTNDLRQLNDPGECRAIKKSGLHHITYEMEDGVEGLALAAASILAAIRPVMKAPNSAAGQRIVRLRAISKRRDSFELSNPASEPTRYPYW